MQICNSDYGGFVVSKNVLDGKPIRYTFREESTIKQLNGWTAYSAYDDEEYVNNSTNFEIVEANTMFKIAPVMAEIFVAPYGTDLCWLYEKNIHTGFYDLTNEKEVSIEQIVQS
ncbi:MULTISPECIES: DUF2185 domain-containing protein [Enterococcus]|uniref:DUF2185 domain-containing protein n=1 Tax=Enterococcus TaxID=1350 RepID=UPI000EEF1738|nr:MULTISPECIES: DUF2185 domain-containing protein [Enterococcus]HCM87836.1 DUF2185 domain-containing protein [Enterococcus sp.]